MRKTTGRTMNEILASFSSERQKHIQEGAENLIQEYKSLQEFRKAIGWTQEELSDKLELKQANISQLEKRDDTPVE